MRLLILGHLKMVRYRTLAALETALCPRHHASSRRDEVLHDANLHVNFPQDFPHPPVTLRLAAWHVASDGALVVLSGLVLAAGGLAFASEAARTGDVAAAATQVSVALMVVRVSWQLVNPRHPSHEVCATYAGRAQAPAVRLRRSLLGLAALLVLAVASYPGPETAWDIPIVAGHLVAAGGLFAAGRARAPHRFDRALLLTGIGAALVGGGHLLTVALAGTSGSVQLGSGLAGIGALLYSAVTPALRRRYRPPPIPEPQPAAHPLAAA